MSQSLENWGDVSVGDKLPTVRRTVTQDVINQYADASGDHNPLHIDPEFAKNTFYGQTIAHGLMTLAFVSQMMTQWGWKGWSYGGETDFAFLSPVFPGDEVEVCAEVEAIEKRDTGIFARCKLNVTVGDKTILGGTISRRLGDV